MFVVNGGVYGVAAPVFGMICDRYSPKSIAFLGAVLMVISFALMGPLPFFPFGKSKGLIIFALVLQGIGLGAQVVSGFADAHRQAILNGFPDTIDTYGLISGLWTSVFALGAFIGPTLAGIMFDAVGFPWAAMLIVGNQLMVMLLLTVFFMIACYQVRKGYTPIKSGEDDSLLNGSSSTSGYQATADRSLDDHEHITSEEARELARRRRREQVPRRSRKYSEVVSVGTGGSVSRSLSMAYPRFMGPAVANSYRNPPPSYAQGGAVAGSVADIENIPEHEIRD
jgi:MFS family permease